MSWLTIKFIILQSKYLNICDFQQIDTMNTF